MEFSSVRPRYESVRAARLYYAADCLLPADSAPKKAKRLELAQRILESGNTFHNMIFSDECSISPPWFMCGGNQ